MIRLFKVSIPSSVIALILSEAILVFSCYILAAYLLLDVAVDVFLFDDGGLWRIMLVVAVIMLGLYFHDLYENYRIRSRLLLIQQFCLVVGRGIGAQRLLFLGASPASREIIAHLVERPELGLAPVGFVENDAEAPEQLSGTPRLGAITELTEIVELQKPDRIVVGMTERRQRLPVERLLELRFSGIHIEEVATSYEAVFGRVSTRDLRPSQLIFSTELGPRPGSVTLQSLYSYAIALVAVIITLPIMLIVALIVKFTSSGPVLFRQIRTGYNGAPFQVFKFRSMRQDAELKTGAVWATKDDPRITHVGKWLRKLRLDELPQLFNVLRGEMSIVGPRPERPEFVAVLQEKIAYYRQRHCVKPGITGWAQINHKYGDTIEDTIMKLEYDLYYIKNLSLSLDLYIVFHTVKTMLLGRGAQ
jgi:sugar transferase (PEP-CTERM system associated)